MNRSSTNILAATIAVLAAGCSTMADPNPALDRARAGYRALQADPQVTLLAPTELTQAGESLRTADAAWIQRQDRHTVEHLTYLAQQRIAVARETANTRMWEKSAMATRSQSASDRARIDGETAARNLSLAQRTTQEKETELAVAKAGAQTDKSRVTDLEMQLRDMNAKHTDRGEVVTLGDVLFDSNRAELRAGSLQDMSKLVEFFKRHPKRTALIEGFTDSEGNERANLDLSTRRASAVRDALIGQGVFPDRLTARGRGEARPTSTNATQAGRQANRRVEIVLSDEEGVAKAR